MKICKGTTADGVPCNRQIPPAEIRTVRVNGHEEEWDFCQACTARMKEAIETYPKQHGKPKPESK